MDEGKLSLVAVMNRRALNLTVIALASVILLTSACQNINFRLNEDGAVESMRHIRTAQQTYKGTQSTGRYGTLKELSEAGLLKPTLADGVDQGYRFDIRVSGNSYKAFAVPIEYGQTNYKGTGRVSLYVDETGVIRGADKGGKEADAGAEPLVEK